MDPDDVVTRMRREIDPVEYREIRELWKRHSKAEDARDLPGLLSTLTEDCVYDLPQFGRRFNGHAGAERFYRELLAAFPDLRFDLEQIVIGPQGVFEAATARGTQRGPWLDRLPTGRTVSFEVLIYFPWDPERRRFRGERIWVHGAPPP